MYKMAVWNFSPRITINFTCIKYIFSGLNVEK